MSVLIWVQTVCKGYQQTTKVAASKGKVINFEGPHICSLFFFVYSKLKLNESGLKDMYIFFNFFD